MFALFLHFLRWALCASAFALLGVGAQAGWGEASNVRETPAWGSMKHAKPPLIVVSRVGAACPLAAAVHTGGARVAGQGALRGEAFDGLWAERGFAESVFGATIRDLERERRAARRTTSGVVRLLI